MVFTTLTRLASKRIPLIKFRNGGNVSGSTPSATAPAGSAKAASAPAAAPMAHKAVSGPAIEDWQLPTKYRRRLIDPIEIDYINRGGPP